MHASVRKHTRKERRLQAKPLIIKSILNYIWYDAQKKYLVCTMQNLELWKTFRK